MVIGLFFWIISLELLLTFETFVGSASPMGHVKGKEQMSSGHGNILSPDEGEGVYLYIHMNIVRQFLLTFFIENLKSLQLMWHVYRLNVII